MLASSSSWLRCEVAPGIWSGEVAILCNTSEGITISFFAPEAEVKVSSTRSGSDDQTSLVRVSVLDSSDDYSLISLPSTPIEGKQTVKVRSDQLVAA